MVVANFAAVQDDVTLYSDQIKVQVSMDSGRVVGAECSQYLANHTRRTDIVPTVDVLQAREMVSGRLSVKSERLCVIPTSNFLSMLACLGRVFRLHRDTGF